MAGFIAFKTPFLYIVSLWGLSTPYLEHKVYIHKERNFSDDHKILKLRDFEVFRSQIQPLNWFQCHNQLKQNRIKDLCKVESQLMSYPLGEIMYVIKHCIRVRKCQIIECILRTLEPARQITVELMRIYAVFPHLSPLSHTFTARSTQGPFIQLSWSLQDHTRLQSTMVWSKVWTGEG